MPDRATGPRRRLTYANVASTIALFLAVGGGSAYAVSHYVITSTGQIKPSVLKQLKGARGPKGVTGPRGPKGLQGMRGLPGSPNPDATTVDGEKVSKIFQNDPPNTVTNKQIFSGGDLTLTYSCNSGGYPVLQASTSANGLLEFAGSFNAQFKSGQTDDAGSFSDFDILGGVSDDYGTLHFSYGDTNGQVVSGLLSYWSGNALNTSTNCALFGTVWSS